MPTTSDVELGSTPWPSISAKMASTRERGELGHVVHSAWVNTDGVEGGPVVSYVVVGVLQRPPQPLELQGAELVARRALERLEVLRTG